MSDENRIYEIGETTWFRGELATITSEPIMLHGGEFQEAKRLDGKKLVIATPRAKEKSIQENRARFREQQAQFARLAEKS